MSSKLWIEKKMFNIKNLNFFFKNEDKTYEYFIRSLSQTKLKASNESMRIISVLLSLSKNINNLLVPGPIDDYLNSYIPYAKDISKYFGNSFNNNAYQDSEIKEVINSGLKVYTPSKGGKRVGTFFTGGIDSFYTLIKNKVEITDIIYVYGFDIALADKFNRDRISTLLKEVSLEFNVNLIELETNLKDLYKSNKITWDLAHGNALGAVANFLYGDFKKIYIPSTHSYGDSFPWGSHPLLDHMWSTSYLKIVHDGAEVNRFQKTILISKSDFALQKLNVCWIDKSKYINCGKCEKCLRTMIALSIQNKLESCSRFPNSINIEDMKFLTYSFLKKPNKFSFIKSLEEELNKIPNIKYRKDLYEIRKLIFFKLKLFEIRRTIKELLMKIKDLFKFIMNNYF